MRLFPTRSALDLAVAGAAVVLVGILLFQPAIVAWGGALIVSLSLARAVTLFEVARVRSAGFEMVWRSSSRSVRLARGQTLSLVAEVRNRDTRAARYVQLRVIGAPAIDVEVESGSGEVPAGGRLEVNVKLRALRVGWHGLFGLGLELRGGPGSFEVPLTFSNPFGVEVVPPTGVARNRRVAVAGVRAGRGAARHSADETEFSEIRDHQMGDSLKRVAWKASARRGRLLVRKYEAEERQVVWFVLDGSVPLWAGRMGHAPLDLAIDCVGELAHQHLRAEHVVGLAVVAGSKVSRVAAARGPGHERKLHEALMATASLLEPERSALDERSVGVRVYEHLRSLAPIDTHGLMPQDLDGIAKLAARALGQAPFSELRVSAPTPREELLRSYLAVFGISSPPKLEPRSPRIDQLLGETVLELTRGRARAGLIYVCAPLPDLERWAVLGPPLRTAQRRRARLRWLHAPELPGLDLGDDPLGQLARTAAKLRTESERSAAALRLRQLGVPIAACLAPEPVAAQAKLLSVSQISE